MIKEEQIRLGKICPYCLNPPKLVDSEAIYGRSYGMMWLCSPCGAYVGTHKNSKNHNALGRLANKELRDLKKQTHAVFDPLWKRNFFDTRKEAYRWLAKMLKIEKKKCHIGMFDEKLCQAAIKLCVQKLNGKIYE